MIRSHARQRTTPWIAGIGALLYDAGEKGLMNSVELGRHPRRRNIDETVRSLLVEPDHPVPQRLTIHAANLCRLFPRGPLEHGRNRQQPSRLRSVFRSLGKPANLAGGIVRPHRNSMAHGKPPQFATLNHAAIDSGIPGEPTAQRLGIRRWRNVIGRPTSRSPSRAGSPEPAPSNGISLAGVTRAAMTPATRMRVSCLNACWLTPGARGAPACIDRHFIKTTVEARSVFLESPDMADYPPWLVSDANDAV